VLKMEDHPLQHSSFGRSPHRPLCSCDFPYPHQCHIGEQRDPGLAALCDHDGVTCDVKTMRVQIVDIFSVAAAAVHVCTRSGLVTQFLALGIFPSSIDRPQLAFTLALLDQAEFFSIDGCMSVHQFESTSTRFRAETGSLHDQITPSTLKQSLQLTLHRYRSLKSALIRKTVGNHSACCPACAEVGVYFCVTICICKRAYNVNVILFFVYI
jgi:hypothetical protein